MWRRIFLAALGVVLAACSGAETVVGVTNDVAPEVSGIVEMDGGSVVDTEVPDADVVPQGDGVTSPDGVEELPVDIGPPPECEEDDECGDENECTDELCVEGTCVFEPNTAPCDDGDACTLNDACLEGACAGPDALECDDGNSCSVDSCNSESGCYHWFMLSQECRPQIIVDYPGRASSLVWEDLTNPNIIVSGSVSSGAGPITEFLFNGAAVELEDDGTFAVEFAPSVGGNTIELDAKDVTGLARKRVQSFHWAPEYLDPKEEAIEIPCAGEVAGEVCIRAYLAESELQWSPAHESCKAEGGLLAVLNSKARNDAAQAQRQSVCGEASAWIGMNDNIKEGNYVWVDGSPAEGVFEPWAEPGLISGVSGDPLFGDADGAAGLIEDGGVLQDGVVGSGLGGGAYLSQSAGGSGSDYMEEGEPVVLDYDFGEEVSLGSLIIGLYDYADGAGHPDSATEFSIDFGTTPGGSEVAAGVIVKADLSGPAGQVLFFGQTYVASTARITVTDNGYEPGTDESPAQGGDRVGLTEAMFHVNAIYTNWAQGEPNDWNGDEDVVGMYVTGQWNDYWGDNSLPCYICQTPTSDLEYTGHSDPGMGIYLSPKLIDDGDHQLPANDLGTVFEMVFAEFDLGKVIPSPAAEDLDVSGGIYDLFISNLTNDKPTVGLMTMEGGWALNANIANVQADVAADKKSGNWLLPGKITGTMYVDLITIDADVTFSVDEDHQLVAEISNAEVSIEGVVIDIDGWLGGIIEGLIQDSLDSLISDIESTLGQELGNALAPMLVDALGTLAFGFDFELPSLSPEGEPVQMFVATDFSTADFQEDGDVLGLRSVAVPAVPIIDHESLGAPARSGCGLTDPELTVLKEAPMEIVMNDDTINMILYSAWRGGFLEFELPPELLGDIDLESFGVHDLVAHVSGLLPPAVSDCGNGQLMLHIGDVKVEATMNFFGAPLDMVAYASFDAQFEILATTGEISFGVDGIDNVKLELTAEQDDQIEMEDVLVLLLKENLVPALTDGLSGDALGGLAIPDIALDVAGTPLEIGIHPLWVQRANGNNVVGATLGEEPPPPMGYDLAEGDLTDWSAECQQECTADLTADSENAVVGEVAVRVDAEGAADLRVGVHAPEGAFWDVDGGGDLKAMLRTATDDAEAWVLDPSIGHPVLELRDENWNVMALTPSANLLSQTQDTWQPLTVPLAAGEPWTQLMDPEFNLSTVVWAGVYINGVSDQPYTVWIDGMSLPLVVTP